MHGKQTLSVWKTHAYEPVPILSSTGSVGKESCYQNLYKASFDNMAVYLQKKEERLQQRKSKRKDPQHESNGQTKKLKT